ncbi:hypothetical protein [Pseudomonas aeruginosa]|uniref:hypothetical protein n=1 Tax=Pseudomonas aeruginosa TaxID=287 RepID=UPI0024974788|nr:hypothetical protein [Pseudomonas aeruginosa]MDI2177200.1 hypothetical protein [Pseudomonas aeruginosa]
MSRFKLLDAQAALGFVVSQTTYIERQVNEIVYPDIQYPQLIPVDTSAPEWIKTVTFYSADKVGKADWVNGNADDLPLASTRPSAGQHRALEVRVERAHGCHRLWLWSGRDQPGADARHQPDR